MNIFTTTGFALVILAAIDLNSFLIIDSYFLIPYRDTIFQILGANIVIHLGLLLTRKFESQYLFLESLLDVVFITIVLVFFGWIFDWFHTLLLRGLGILALMAVVIYVVATFLRMGRVREEINEINKLLEERKKRSSIKNRRSIDGE